jgi:5S rRNA maturation endonuclease (ribonuclease M5)
MNILKKERRLYRFERFIGKGGSSIFVSLLLIFIVCFLIMITVRWLLLLFVPGWDAFESYADHVWGTYLQMTDPGNMNYDSKSSSIIKISTIISGFIGVVIFSTFIAFLTASIQKTIYEFRKGITKVIEENHTLILGWNERVLDILSELILANESQKKACIVILADFDKEAMDDRIYKNIPSAKSTYIATRKGNAASLNQLQRVSAEKAKSVIILAQCADNASPEELDASDNYAMKVIMALIAAQGGKNKIPIIAEIFSQEKRNLISFLKDDKIISVDSWQMLGKLLFQTSLTSGLERVFYEILSFAGSELYFFKAPWGKNIRFYDLAYHFIDGVPMGIQRQGQKLILGPKEDFVLQANDEILILAQDDSTIHFHEKALYHPRQLPAKTERLTRKPRRTLILGWHHIGVTYIRSAASYLMAGSSFDIMLRDTAYKSMQQIRELQYEYPQLNIKITEQDPLCYDFLKAIQPFDYDQVLILSQKESELSPEKIDAETLMILLMMRKILSEDPLLKPHTTIITQVLNSENQELLAQTEADDFIASNKLITMMLAQMSEQPRMKKLYDDIFQSEGSEIYVKPAKLYFDEEQLDVTFADLIALAQKRKEICLGIRIDALAFSPSMNFGVRLNLPKDKKFTITQKDYLVVLAEDEL